MDGTAVDTDDAAARAFDGVRVEVALLRRAVEGLAAERAGIEVPDYAPTLAQIAQAVRATSARLDRMSEAPALALGPEEMARRIEAAGDRARRDDHDALARARTALDQAMRQIAAYIISERKRYHQDWWLAGAAVSGLSLGMSLWATLVGPIDRAVPEGWRWPEERAAEAVDLPMWQAGEHLMATADPASFHTIIHENEIIAANREAVAKCFSASAKTHAALRCTIRVEANPKAKGA